MWKKNWCSCCGSASVDLKVTRNSTPDLTPIESLAVSNRVRGAQTTDNFFLDVFISEGFFYVITHFNKFSIATRMKIYV